MAAPKKTLIPPNPLIDAYDLLGIPVVYLSMLASMWLLTEVPVTVATALWLAGLVIAGCALLLGLRALFRIIRHKRQS
ncbi:hypothetical protein GCM10027590_68460 [Nocardiopsis nanhaiensis]